MKVHNAKIQLHPPRQVKNMLGGITLEDITLDKYKKEKGKNESKIDFRLKAILNPLIKKMEDLKYKSHLPLITFIDSSDSNGRDIWYDSFKQRIYINKIYFMITSDTKLVQVFLKEISKHLYHTRMFPNIEELRMINYFILSNQKVLKPYIKCNCLCIPTNQKGIMLPKIPIVHFDQFVTSSFVLYVQGLLVKNSIDSNINDIIEAMLFYFER